MGSIVPGEGKTKGMTDQAGENTKNHSVIQINPALLSSNREQPTTIMVTASAELVIHCGRVRMDTRSQMSVDRIVDLVRDLNSHV